jgi:hypothetical protein
MFILLLPLLCNSCYLLGGESSQKPKPSLTKCYRFNTAACCVSAHDAQVQNDYNSLLSTQCQREYDYLEDYFCYGCNPTQDQYINYVQKTITICQSYAEKVWGGALLQPSNTFDNCGMNTYWRSSVNTITPSTEWNTAFQFFYEVKPSYFSEFFIIIADNSANCYSGSLILMLGLIYLVI